jgi:L-amino acid N-acyltransferase YncA
MTEVIQIKPGDDQFHLFEQAGKNLYADDVLQKQLANGMNLEFLYKCYIVTKDGMAVGRAALYHNPSLIYQNKKAVSIGNYECADHADCANELMQTVINDARQLGAKLMIGPMNGSTWDDYRFSKHHRHPNFLLEPYHHLYYNDQFVQFGFRPIANYVSNVDYSLSNNHPSILKREEELTAKGVTIRSIELNNYENELRKLYPFICSAFKTNFLYTQISEQNFVNKYKQAKPMIDPAFVLLAEDETGTVIGFIFCYQDLYLRNEKQLIVKTVARNPSAEWKGLGHVMGNRVIRTAAQRGFKAAIHAFVIELGTSTGLSDSFLGNSYKNYVLYGKEI